MSPRIPALDDRQAPPRAAKILDRVGKSLGRVPNLHRTLANAPAALEAYAALGSALASGTLDPKLREQVAVATAGLNGCSYCASAHTALGKGLSIDASELSRNLTCESSDERTSEVLSFVRSLLEERGAIGDSKLEALRGAGFDDQQVLEIVAHVAMNVFTNMVNNLARTEIDFPRVDVTSAA